MSDRRVLVVGTTPDYIAYIHGRYPGRALFLTDQSQRAGSTETAPGKASEVVCSLSDSDSVLCSLRKHLKELHQSLSGVACYDCEWLDLAAELAKEFRMPYPSVESIRLSRDKYLTKKRWAECGVRSPKVELVHDGQQALRLTERFEGSVVLKPLTGTGSELTFRCNDHYELTTAFRAIKVGLARRRELPLYKLDPVGVGDRVPDHPVLAEEFIKGREYSADFVIDGGSVLLVRVAKKLGSDTLPFGTTTAYIVPARLPGWLKGDTLADRLRDAANALGLTRAICMVDFMISQDEIVLLELTPRIGGDCLPPLIRRSCGLDTIGLALDFAEGRQCAIPPLHQWTELVGMRLFSPRSGVFSNVSCKGLSKDPRVKEIFIKRAPGHEITIPPEDYDSWLLGHVIFEPRLGVSTKAQCRDMGEKISINLEQHHDQKLGWLHNADGRTAQQPRPTA